MMIITAIATITAIRMITTMHSHMGMGMGMGIITHPTATLRILSGHAP